MNERLLGRQPQPIRPVAAARVLATQKIWVYDRAGRLIPHLSGPDSEVRDRATAELGDGGFFFRVSLRWARESDPLPADGENCSSAPKTYDLWTAQAAEVTPALWAEDESDAQPGGELTWVRDVGERFEISPDDVWLVIRDVVLGRRRSFIEHSPTRLAE